MNIINKKTLEKLLGFEINDFSVEPKFNKKNNLIELDVKVSKKQITKFITIK